MLNLERHVSDDRQPSGRGTHILSPSHDTEVAGGDGSWEDPALTLAVWGPEAIAGGEGDSQETCATA